jgi:hypothetical protein
MRWIFGGICFAPATFGAEELSWQTPGKAVRPRAQQTAAVRSEKVENFIFRMPFLP